MILPPYAARLRLLVAGGRDYDDAATLDTVLNRIHRERCIGVLIHGAYRGADSLADRWGMMTPGIVLMRFPADWAALGGAAGPERNQRMIDAGRPQAVVAFPRKNGQLGDGTADLIRRALAAGLPVWKPRAAWGDRG